MQTKYLMSNNQGKITNFKKYILFIYFCAIVVFK